MAQPHPTLPEGRPAIVLFDIVGSTKHLLALGSTAYTSQQQQPFFDLCDRLRLENHGEQYGSHQGDALLYIFPLAPHAVAFANALLSSLRDHPIDAHDEANGTLHRVQVRLAVHQAQETMHLSERGDYGYHPDVVYTARLMAIALDDQVLLSETAYSAIDEKQFDCQEYINRRIKNWDTPQTVYELLWDGTSKGEPGSRYLPGWFREMNRYIPRPDLENAIIHLFREKTPAGSLYRLITLRGYGGMGKTRLALQCAANLAALFGDAMHLIALGDIFAEADESRTRRDTQDATLCALLAERIGRPYSLQGEQALPGNLPQAMPRGMRLLVIDNYESVNCDAAAYLLADLLEANEGLHILVTGREALEMDDIEKQFPIESMRPEEARQMFVERAAQKRDLSAKPLTAADEAAIKRILTYTEHIPLALELAAARSGQKSFTEIADGLEKAPLGAETETATRHRRADRAERHKSLTKSLNWSYSLLALPTQQAFPCLGLFSDSFTVETVGSACNVPQAQDALDELLEASLTSRFEGEDQQSRYRMLRPTRAYAAEKFEALSTADAIRRQFIDYYVQLVEENGGSDNLENDAKRRHLDREWRNALTAADYARRDIDTTCLFADGLFLYMARYGRWTEVEPLCQNALALRESILGPEHPATALSLHNMASFYDSQGRYAEAEPLLKRAIAIREKTLGNDHSSTLLSLTNLASIYNSHGRYAEAEPLFVRALAIMGTALGPEHPNQAALLNNAASLYENQGRYPEAEAFYTKALALREKVLGLEHPDTALSLNNLGTFYGKIGRYPKAEPLLKRALTIWEKALGPEHPDTASSLNNLAFLYTRQGHYSEAEPLYTRALAIREKALGPEHPDTALSLDNLAHLYTSQRRYSEAEPLLKRALTIWEKALGPDHPKTATNFNNLAFLYDNQGRYSEAEPLYLRALAINEKILGPEHLSTALNLCNLAFISNIQGQYTVAEPLFVRALQIREKVLGPRHPDTSSVRKDYVTFLRARGRDAEAQAVEAGANISSEPRNG